MNTIDGEQEAYRKGRVLGSKPLVAIIAFGAGFFLHWMIAIAVLPKGVADHWRVLNEYRDFVRTPRNYEPVPGSPGLGRLKVESMPDYYPSLEYLVRAGELQHVDIVLPNVPVNSASSKVWFDWAQNNPDVYEATGSPSYADYQPSGKQPVHLNIWIRPRAKLSVQELIDSLEKLGKAIKEEP